VSLTDSYSIAPPAGCIAAPFMPGILCPTPSSVFVVAGDGNDTVNDWDGPGSIDGGPGLDKLDGRGGDDSLQGGDGDDALFGGPGNDALDGGPANDRLESWTDVTTAPSNSAGADTLRGGPGFDTLSYEGRPDPLSISFDGAPNDGAAGEADNVDDDVERAEGGSANDTLIGSATPNDLAGLEGDDTLRGGEGDDALDGGMGKDTVLGEQGADDVAGGHGEDVVDGGPGRDNIFGEYELGCSNLLPCVGGADEIRARDGEADLVACGIGTDIAQLDTVDVVRDIPGATICETVTRSGGSGGTSPGGGGTKVPKACARLSGSARSVCTSLDKAVAKCKASKRRAACVKRAAARARKQCRKVRPKSRRAGCARAVGSVVRARR
jgi:Ca2+-binding RTX toxin-like protein